MGLHSAMVVLLVRIVTKANLLMEKNKELVSIFGRMALHMLGSFIWICQKALAFILAVPSLTLIDK